MAGILDLMGHVQQQGELGRQRGQQGRLASLMGQAFQAPREQRQPIFGQMAQVDPQSAFAAEKGFRDMDDNARAQLGQTLAAFDTLPDEQKALAYPQIAQQARSMLGLPVPMEWNPAMAPNIQKLAQVLSGGASEDLKSVRIGEDGFYYAIRGGQMVNTGVRADPRMKIMEAQGGIVGVNERNLQASPVTMGQQRAPSEVPFTIDPSLPPEIQADIRRSEASGQPWTQAPQGGQQLQAAPKAPPAPSEFERRMQAARQMGVSEDEIRRMVVGREGAAAGAKPMPAAALRMVTDANAALKEVETVNSTLQRIREEIASDKLNLGPIRNVINRGRVAAGFGNDESTRLSTTERSLRGLQNAALRLNKGVQTEGDAKRIWQELLGNLNDEASVLANIDRLMELNQRAQELHEMNLETVNSNYGRQQPAQQQDAPRSNAVNGGGWSIEVSE